MMAQAAAAASRMFETIADVGLSGTATSFFSSRSACSRNAQTLARTSASSSRT